MPETIGQQLKRARQARKITLEKAFEATHIRPHFLQALEADDYSAMSSAAQARGFLKNYCVFLELDLDEMLASVQKAPVSQMEEIHGPLPQVEIAPLPPEPVPSSRPGPAATAIPTQPSQANPWLNRLRQVIRPAGPAEITRPALLAQPPASEIPVEEPLPVPEPEGQAPVEVQTVVPAPQQDAPAPDVPVVVEETPASTREAEIPRWRQRLQVLLASRSLDEGTGSGLPPVGEAQSSEDLESTAQPVDTGESAEKIFIGIGRDLRKRRELLSLTPEEVERHIHVKAEFIVALEQGDLSKLPSAVQTRGMLANYSDFLDLDTDSILLRFADSLQASHRARHPKAPGTARQPVAVKPSLPPLRSFMAGDMLFGLAIVVMVVALIAWGLGRIFQEQAAPIVLPTAPSISDVLAGTSAPALAQEVTLIPVLDTPIVAEESTATPAATDETVTFDPAVPVNLTVVAIERTFMRVIVDGEEIFNGRVTPGVVYTYEGTTTIQILAGNGAALRVTYNGRDLGLLGDFGQVAQFIYTANEIVTPLPPVSPTPTASPFVSPTPTSTPTRTPTATRTPAAVPQ